MWNEDDGREIDDAFVRRTELRDAVVISLSGEDYTLRDCMTGGEFEAVASQAVTYAIGKRVSVRHNATGRAAGRKPEIMGVSQATGNGVIIGQLEYAVERSAGTITRLPALPIRLVAGGAPEVVTIYGVRLSGSAAYSTGDITDSVAQRLAATALIIRPVASVACAPGRYSLTFEGQTIQNFFEVE